MAAQVGGSDAAQNGTLEKEEDEGSGGRMEWEEEEEEEEREDEKGGRETGEVLWLENGAVLVKNASVLL